MTRDVGVLLVLTLVAVAEFQPPALFIGTRRALLTVLQPHHHGVGAEPARPQTSPPPSTPEAPTAPTTGETR
jgi:hypothetical protein